MKATATRRNTCRLCGSNHIALAVPIKASPVADAYVPAKDLAKTQETYALDLYLCQSCGHVQLLEVVDPEILFGDYIYTTSISLGLVQHFGRFADAMSQRFSFPQNSLAIDIGSNDGTLLKFFKEKGLRVLGIDPARAIAQKATEAGIETLPEFFDADLARLIKQKHGTAAIVTANNVFAHSDNLPGMADGIRELLAPNGVFVFEVSYLVDILDKLLFDTVYHEHLCYHSIKPLDSFFRRHGMELFDVERLPTKGGSIRGFAQLQGGPHRKAPIVFELLNLEANLQLDKLEVFNKFAAKLEDIKQELHTLLRRLKAEGKTIAGYGASATVTTLIYNFELAQFLNYIVDDNPSRNGLFSPGCHLPVLASQAIYEKKPDYTVILAWQYADPIMKKNQDYLQRGGHFILPLPAVSIT